VYLFLCIFEAHHIFNILLACLEISSSCQCKRFKYCTMELLCLLSKAGAVQRLEQTRLSTLVIPFTYSYFHDCSLFSLVNGMTETEVHILTRQGVLQEAYSVTRFLLRDQYKNTSTQAYVRFQYTVRLKYGSSFNRINYSRSTPPSRTSWHKSFLSKRKTNFLYKISTLHGAS
jgi:hypothetical protein